MHGVHAFVSVATSCESFFVFFFQAEDGIRDVAVTGVQTCALPIWPAYMMARWSHVSATRVAIDPQKTGAGRQLGSHDVSVNLYDIDLSLNLTGQKTFHHFIPVMNLGLGVASCGCTVKDDPYSFGTPFAFSFGGGLRYAPGGRFA